MPTHTIVLEIVPFCVMVGWVLFHRLMDDGSKLTRRLATGLEVFSGAYFWLAAHVRLESDFWGSEVNIAVTYGVTTVVTVTGTRILMKLRDKRGGLG